MEKSIYEAIKAKYLKNALAALCCLSFSCAIGLCTNSGVVNYVLGTYFNPMSIIMLIIIGIVCAILYVIVPYEIKTGVSVNEIDVLVKKFMELIKK